MLTPALTKETKKTNFVDSNEDLNSIASRKMSPDLKKSITLVLMGNFMEYFDLMLGVHLSVALNHVFLPQDIGYEHILRPLTFLMPLCMRPIAALVWGYIGDEYGRKIVLITTMMFMSLCCIFLTFLPTYAQWGLTSTLSFFLIRSIQSIMASGENGSADVYIAEMIPEPRSYFMATVVECTCSLGGLFACLVGSLSLIIDPVMGWKIAFVVGATIAVLGSYARKDLKETTEFLEFTYQKENKKNKNGNIEKSKTDNKEIYFFRNILSEGLAFTYVGMFFYVKYAYLPSILAKQFGWSISMILINSTCLLLLSIICELTVGLISLKIDPRKIAKTLYSSGIVCCLFFSTQCWLLSSATTIVFIQAFFYIFATSCLPLLPIFIKSYPTRHRLKCHMWGLALVKIIAFILTAFVCEKLNNINLLLLVMAGAAGISLAGVYLFKAYDVGMSKGDGKNHPFKSGSISENDFFKWQKTRSN